MDVVGHQTIGPDADVRLVASLPQQIPIKAIIVVGEKDAFAPIATLRDVMRQTGGDVAGDAGHGRGPPGLRQRVEWGNKASVTVCTLRVRSYSGGRFHPDRCR